MSYLIASPSMKDPYFQNSVVCLCSYDIQGAFGFVVNKAIPITTSELLQQLPEIKEWYAEQNSNAVQTELKDFLEERHFLLQPILFGGPVNVECGFVMFELPEDLRVEAFPEIDANLSNTPETPDVNSDPNVLYLHHLDALWTMLDINEQETNEQETNEQEVETSPLTKKVEEEASTEKKELLIIPAKGNIVGLLEHNIPFKMFLGYSGWGEQQLTSEVERGSWLFAHQSDFTLNELFMVPIEAQYDMALASLGIQKEFLVMK